MLFTSAAVTRVIVFLIYLVSAEFPGCVGENSRKLLGASLTLQACEEKNVSNTLLCPFDLQNKAAVDLPASCTV